MNGLFNVARSDQFAVDLLAGFRYLELEESLSIAGGEQRIDLSNGVSTVSGSTATISARATNSMAGK